MIGMLSGFAAHFSMYLAGAFTNDSFFKPHLLMNMDPIIVGLFVSFLATYVGCLISPAPPQRLVKKYFYKRKALQRT